MNCSDWEQQIASEQDSAELDEHLRGCERCREFAGEIEKNRAALIELMAELTIDPAAFAAAGTGCSRDRSAGELDSGCCACAVCAQKFGPASRESEAGPEDRTCSGCQDAD